MLKKSCRIILPQASCLIMQSSIAQKLGRTNALFLQQLHYKITSESSVGVVFEGRRWVYNTYQDWVEDIKTISQSTIKRSIAFLKSRGIILCKALSKNKAMRVNYYTINYDCLNEILGLKQDKVLNHPISMDIHNEPIINSGFSHQVKMAPTSGHFDPMLYTKITSDNNINTSEEKSSQKFLSIDMANKSKQVSDIKKNYLAKLLIDTWFQIVEQGSGELNLTKKRAQFLVAAFNLKFEKSMEKWKKYCQDIASSRFLMGEIKDFRATLDWGLKFDNIQKILEGNYGIGDRVSKSPLLSQSDVQEEISSSEESQEIKDFRTICLKTVGNAKYISYFKNLTIEFREEGGITLISPHKFAAENLERNCYSYLRLILQGFGEHITKISILAPGETSGRFIERNRGGVNIPGLPSVLTVALSLPEEPLVEEPVSEDEPLPEIFSKTQALLTKLKENIPPNEFPSWLGKIEVEEVGHDGMVVVTLDNPLAVGWCRAKFSNEIIEAVASLWAGVDGLVIRQKAGDMVPTPVGSSLKKSENIKEKSKLEQAVHSFLSVCQTIEVSESISKRVENNLLIKAGSQL